MSHFGKAICAGGLFVGVVARADERAGFDVAEAHLQRLFFHEQELVGRVVARERQVVL